VRERLHSTPSGSSECKNRRAEREATRFAEHLSSACSRALGDLVDGVVLHGSLALGDYVPGRSDVDLLVIVARPLLDDEAASFVEAIAVAASEAPAPFDLWVVTREVTTSPTQRPPMELAVEFRPDADQPLYVERRIPGERDLVIEFSICRSIGRSLAGPPAPVLIGEVPADWVLDVGDAQLADWQASGDDPPDAELTALTACRIWRFAEEGGRYCSKTAAGEWALGRDPSLAAVSDALRRRQGDPTASIDAAEVERLLRVVRERIAAVRASAKQAAR
jgi:predicted nucleotidyltransferase